ncbi:potassium channel subfamily K member 2 [Hyalella azteca]|uniref:Potassium channel subfamily K member 2 n=1 Tax=Hyalella azteca TaxID=294128 RepID=A0A8B7N6L0_HYAAZ|nr:potassium channel subfamily K member 2 [Hyalella azteca]
MRMSKKRWLVMLLVYIIYLLLGALVFQVLEAPSSRKEKLENEMAVHQLQLHSVETLLQLPDGDTKDQVLRMLHAVQDLYGPILPNDFNASANYSYEFISLVSNETLTDEYLMRDWDFWNAFFFSFITITTIGYGHLSPRTTIGQQFCILYSLFGIPLNTMVFVTLADFYSDYVMTSEDRKGGNGRTTAQVVNRALVYLMPGLLLFLIVPALIMMEVEGWTFLQSFYFAFITLTTIGFGDYVAGRPGYYSYWDFVYKIYLMLWTMFGLAYLIMIVSFLIDALKSDPVRMMEERTARLLQKRTARLQGLMNSFLEQHERVHSKANAIQLFREKLQGQDAGQDNPSFEIVDTSTEEQQISESLDSILKTAEEIIPGRSRHSSVVSLAGRKISTCSRLTIQSNGRRSSASSISSKGQSSSIAPPINLEVPVQQYPSRRRSTIVNAMVKILPKAVTERHFHTCHHGHSNMHYGNGDVDHDHSDMHVHGDCCKELLTLAVLVDKIERLLEMTKGDWNEPPDPNAAKINIEEGCENKIVTPGTPTSAPVAIYVTEAPPIDENVEIQRAEEVEEDKNSLQVESVKF